MHNTQQRAIVTGAGGFIGGHLVRRLLNDGWQVRAADIKPLHEWWQIHARADNRQLVDLSELDACQRLCCGTIGWWVFHLAADMGGISFIENNKAACSRNVVIDANMLLAAKQALVVRFFYSSSACVYHAARQTDPQVTALAESDAYYNGGAMPEDGYGWAKLYTERMCRHFAEDYRLPCRVARFHNVYGPMGSWRDGREKAPAAICRKIAEAQLRGEDAIQVWGDGTATRSFCYVEDCVEGILRLTASDYTEPLNLGSDTLISINDLISLIEGIAEYQVCRKYDLSKPQGVRGRNSDNTRIKEVLQWQPTIPLTSGLLATYRWIQDQVLSQKQQQ